MKEYKTAEQIAKETGHLDGLANIRAINKAYRKQDDSALWPIRNKLSVIERAIRKARWFRRESGCQAYGLEYCYLLEQIQSEIVNNERNW